MAQGKSWQKLNWQDPFLLEQQLSDEQRLVRDSARQYAQDRLLPRVQDAFRKEQTDVNQAQNDAHDVTQARITGDRI